MVCYIEGALLVKEDVYSDGLSGATYWVNIENNLAFDLAHPEKDPSVEQIASAAFACAQENNTAVTLVFDRNGLKENDTKDVYKPASLTAVGKEDFVDLTNTAIRWGNTNYNLRDEPGREKTNNHSITTITFAPNAPA